MNALLLKSQVRQYTRKGPRGQLVLVGPHSDKRTRAPEEVRGQRGRDPHRVVPGDAPGPIELPPQMEGRQDFKPLTDFGKRIIAMMSASTELGYPIGLQPGVHTPADIIKIGKAVRDEWHRRCKSPKYAVRGGEIARLKGLRKEQEDFAMATNEKWSTLHHQLVESGYRLSGGKLKLWNSEEKTPPPPPPPELVAKLAVLERQMQAQWDKLTDIGRQITSTSGFLEREEAAVAIQVLNEIRPMGGVALSIRRAGDSTSRAMQVTQEVSQRYPRDWLQASVDEFDLQAGEDFKRGHYKTLKTGWRSGIFEPGTAFQANVINSWKPAPEDRGEAVVMLSPGPALSQERVATHELGHHFEEAVPELLRFEGAFYQERTGQDVPENMIRRLKDLMPTSGYDEDEFTRKDKFFDEYIGKDYGHVSKTEYAFNRPTATYDTTRKNGYSQFAPFYELCSMGFERLFNNPRALDESDYGKVKDTEYAAWIWGLAAGARRLRDNTIRSRDAR